MPTVIEPTLRYGRLTFSNPLVWAGIMPVGTASLSLVAMAALKRQVWANRVFGNPLIAAALLAEYYTKGRFLTSKEIAALAHVSEDTARRTLRKLASIGRVEERVIDRAHVYRIAPELAEKAISMVIDTTP